MWVKNTSRWRESKMIDDRDKTDDSSQREISISSFENGDI